MKKIDRQRVISFLGFCIFVGIIVQVFFGVTYLFRNTDDDRRHIAGLRQEKVDMVYVGGSLYIGSRLRHGMNVAILLITMQRIRYQQKA